MFHRLNDRAIPLVTVAVVVFFVIIRGVCDRRKVTGPEVCPVDRLGDNREQVKLLFDYTKFHITVYCTLATLLIGVASSPLANRLALSKPWLQSAVVAIIAAGLAAGIVAASMPSCTAILNFWDHRTGPYDWRCLTIRSWTFVEHTSFWLAVAWVLVAFINGTAVSSASEVTITVKG